MKKEIKTGRYYEERHTRQAAENCYANFVAESRKAKEQQPEAAAQIDKQLEAIRVEIFDHILPVFDAMEVTFREKNCLHHFGIDREAENTVCAKYHQRITHEICPLYKRELAKILDAANDIEARDYNSEITQEDTSDNITDDTYSVITAIFSDGHREHTVAPTENVGCFIQTEPGFFCDLVWGAGVERFEHCPISVFDFGGVPDDEARWIKDHYRQIKAENDAELASLADCTPDQKEA